MRKPLASAISFLVLISVIFSALCFGVFAVDDYNISSMRPFIDNNSFENTSSDFTGENEKSKYYVTAVELNKLTAGESEDTKTLITSQALSRFDGACYGISATMALAFTGRIENPKSNYYSINLNEDIAFKKLINYYHLTQYCINKAPESTKAVSEGKISEDSLKQIVEYAKSGTPFIITFRTEKLAHTVVACGYEHDKDGTHRVRILDCNQKDEFMYLLVSKRYNSWQFDNSAYESDTVSELSFSTLNVFSPFDLKEENEAVYSTVSSSTVIDTVCTNMSSSFTLTNDEGKTLTFDKGEITGDIDFSDFKYIANEGAGLNTKVVFTIEDSNSYTVQNNNEEIDLTVVGDNGLFFTVQGKNIEKIFAEEGKNTIEGEDMEYRLSALSTEENVDMVNVCGEASEEITIETKDGATVTDSANGKIHVSIVSYGQFYEKDLSIEHGSCSIYYSDIVGTNVVSGKGSPAIKLVIVAFVAVVFIITLISVIKKYKNKDGSEKKGEVKNG